MQNAGKPSIGFILSLVGGILIFVSSAISTIWFAVGSSPFGYGDFWGMMTGFHSMMGFNNDYLLGFSVLGLVCGVIVVIGSFLLNLRPLEHVSWGVIVLVFSAVSLVSMGGWFVGAALGIAGGAFAIAWRSR
jgi:hypothetical protein